MEMKIPNEFFDILRVYLLCNTNWFALNLICMLIYHKWQPPSLGTIAVHKRWLRGSTLFSSEVQFTLNQARWMFSQFINPLPSRQLKLLVSFFPPRGSDLLWCKKLSCWRGNFLGVVLKSATLGGRNGRLCFGKWTLTKLEYEGNIICVFLLSILEPKSLLPTHTDKHKNWHTAYVWVFSPISQQRRWLALLLLSLLNTGMAFLGP